MKTLLHCCCGPCAAGALPQFRQAGYADLLAWFYNPNIQPWQEQAARRDSFHLLMEQEQIPYRIESAYPLEAWLQAVAAQPEQRCRYCYQSRLEAAARAAREAGCPAYSTTLLISPYQNHELLRELGEAYGKAYGLDFVYLDLRPGFRAGQAEARQRGLYLQKYCGCIYSEKDRYRKQIDGAMKSHPTGVNDE